MLPPHILEKYNETKLKVDAELQAVVDRIVTSIARKFLSQPELNYTLDEIARVALDELYADVVVLYEQDVQTKKIFGPVFHGELFDPDRFGVTAFEPDSLVQRLLTQTEQDYFQETVQHIDGSFPLSDGTHDSPETTFVVREEIKSRAIVHLRTDTHCLGLMFLNFRESRQFDKSERDTIFSFAHLAALAIQKAQFHQHQIELNLSVKTWLNISMIGCWQILTAHHGSLASCWTKVISRPNNKGNSCLFVTQCVN